MDGSNTLREISWKWYMFCDTTERIWKFCTMIPKLLLKLEIFWTLTNDVFSFKQRQDELLWSLSLWWRSRISQYKYGTKLRVRPMGNFRQISNNLQTNVCCQSESLQIFLEYVIRLIKKVPANSLTFNSLPLPLFVLCPSQSNVTLSTSIHPLPL